MTAFSQPTDIPAKLHLESVPEAPGVARSFLRSILDRHPRIDDALLSVSELVTNAIRYGPAGAGLVVLVDRRDSAIRVSVHQGHGTVQIDRSGRPRIGGLGLMIVEKVTDAWGLENEVGVWFEIED
jgi:anti-sigma regulatory factor (Ser/Thr protein kinase)